MKFCVKCCEYDVYNCVCNSPYIMPLLLISFSCIVIGLGMVLIYKYFCKKSKRESEFDEKIMESLFKNKVTDDSIDK